MKKLLFCGLSSVLGGVEIYTINLSKNLDKNKYSISFLVDGEAPISYQKLISDINVNVIYSPNLDKKNYFKRIKFLNNLYKTNNFDIIYFNTSFLHRFEIISLAKKHNIKKRIIHSHNSSYGYQPNKFVVYIEEYYKRNLSKYSDTLLACSKTAGDFTFGINDYKIIPNGIEIKKFIYDEQIRNILRTKLNVIDKKIVGHIGRINEQKNPLFLIDILTELCKLDDNYCMIHIGEIQNIELYNQMIDKINKQNLSNNIIFLGKINNVYEYLSVFDVFLLPSFFEGFPISLVEAQANGLPCIISSNIDSSINITGLCEFVDLDNTAKEWAHLILSLNLENDIRINFNEELFEKGYDIKKIYQNIEKIINDIS